ncbi:unnamed protein product [Schistosoma mattheei]|uniref:Uncharacterized protein n=1 Tax=Schistosoma mattheei TaxID=31246 RepID=A0A183Q3B3_9TREM|nr:unnamed protein product [Schistosoma mattheei]
MTKVVFPIKSGGGSRRVGLRLKRTTGYIVEKFLHVNERRMKILAAWTGRASDVHPGQNGEALFSVVTDQTPGSSSNTITLTGRWGDETNSKPEVELILDDQLNYLPIPSWWPCRVVKIRDDVAVVKLNVSPPADATPSEISLCTHLSTVTEIVSRKSLRQPSDDCPCLSPDIIHRHRIEIPKELADL